MTTAHGTKQDPWKLKLHPKPEYEMYRDQKDGMDVIVCVVGKTTLLYDYHLADLHARSKHMATGWSLQC